MPNFVQNAAVALLGIALAHAVYGEVFWGLVTAGVGGMLWFFGRDLGRTNLWGVSK